VTPSWSKDTLKDKEINPLAPAKAAFYSAIFPDSGKPTTKILEDAAGLRRHRYQFLFYNSNNKRYHEFRNEYKDRLLGITNPKYAYLDNDRLIRAEVLPAQPRFVGVGYLRVLRVEHC
jgi:hypothetical protein